jgi:hypothetical protein
MSANNEPRGLWPYELKWVEFMNLQIITLSETMIVHKAVCGAIEYQPQEWRTD